MPIPYRQRTKLELQSLTGRYGAYFMIPDELLRPVLDLPVTREGLCDLLAELGAELHDARSKPLNDVPVAVLMRDMNTVRAAIEALPVELSQAAE